MQTTIPLSLDEQETKTLGQIANKINQSADTPSILDQVLAEVIELTGLRSGWVLLRDNDSEEPGLGNTFSLAAQYNLPADIGADAWRGPCACQDMGELKQLEDANYHVTCQRFGQPGGAWPELQSHVAIPLYSGGELYGLLNAAAPEGEEVTMGALNTLVLLAAHLGTALDRQHLAGLELERHDQEQTTLLMLTSQLLSLSKLEDVVDHLITEVIRLLQADACALVLPDGNGENLIFQASAGRHSDPPTSQPPIPGSGHSGAGRVMRQQPPAVSKSKADRSTFPELAKEWLEAEEFEGMATVPLEVDGHSIGALIVTTRTPREFSQEEIRFLKILANQAGIAIVNARLRKEESQLKRLEQELAIGRKIQRSLLPATSPQVKGWQFSDTYLPAKQVGGDLYDYFELPYGEKRLGIVIGDVADKGVPAALFMATSRTLIRSVALADLTPASTLAEANRLIQQDSPSELFLSAFYGILDTGSGKLLYANAGQNPPLLFHQATGEIEELEARGILLCVLDDISLEERSVDVARGDVLVFYTDGVVEAMNSKDEEFDLARLQQVVKANARGSAAHILDAIVEAIGEFCECVEHTDDITLVVAKRL
jgi:serine phosphatase RsbU (regulator of sigma subunit)